MDFPSTHDFFEAFGIEPVEEDPGMAYCRYVKHSADGHMELDMSFSAIANSFQLMLRYGGKEVVMISSENVKLFEIRRHQARADVHVVFDMLGATSEAVVMLEPDLHCNWWTLRG